MCMCGGVIEIGLGMAIVGVGLRLWKRCTCKCHATVEECSHCTKKCAVKNLMVHQEGMYGIMKKTLHKFKHNLFNIITTIMIIIAILCIGYALYKDHTHIHDEHCTHIEHN